MRWLVSLVMSLCTTISLSSQEMNLIPSGNFTMGDYKYVRDELPTHDVHITSFWIDVTEVTYEYWFEIADWAEKNGYEFSDRPERAKKGATWSPVREQHPMNMVRWYDAIKWCNARSEHDGRLPCYYTDVAHTEVYRTGAHDIDNAHVDWKSSGYRLPTEAEWERSARGNFSGDNYPWGGWLTGAHANYRYSGDPYDNGSTPVGYYNGQQEIHSERASHGGEGVFPRDMANDFGLYDMTGNVGEWCWDWYDESWYSTYESNDPHGPSSKPTDTRTGGTRIYRGGSYARESNLRIAFRHQRLPTTALRNIGIRCVRSTYHDPLLIQSTSVDDNWKNLDWFGYYYQTDGGWIYHEYFGWVYPAGNGSYDNWLWFPERGWIWTCKELFPYMWSDRDQTWLWYDRRQNLFYDFNRQVYEEQ